MSSTLELLRSSQLAAVVEHAVQLVVHNAHALQ